MLLLADVRKYAIKVNYFMFNSTTNEDYTEPCYLAIDTKTKNKKGECMNLLIFEENLNLPNLRVFDTIKEAVTYKKEHFGGIDFCFEDPRVVSIKYDFEENKWVEEKDYVG